MDKISDAFWLVWISGLSQAAIDKQRVSNLVLTGITTDVCVHTTMREANGRGYECLLLTDCCEATDRGYECLLVEDATESYFSAFKQVTLEMIRAQGAIVGWTALADTVLKSLT